MILNDDSEPAKVRRIEELMTDWEDVHNKNYNYDKIIRRFERGGLNSDNFKKILNNHGFRYYLLYEGPDSVEWYENVLSLHNIKVLSDRRAEPLRITNFDKAKNNLKNKKNERKKVS